MPSRAANKPAQDRGVWQFLVVGLRHADVAKGVEIQDSGRRSLLDSDLLPLDN